MNMTAVRKLFTVYQHVGAAKEKRRLHDGIGVKETGTIRVGSVGRSEQ
jgi:hypothetical protein